MPIKSYDHETLAFMADQQAYQTGKKQYNPIPHSRIPSTSRRAAKRLVQPTIAQPRSARLTDPVYLLSVMAGQDDVVASNLLRFSEATNVVVPRKPNGDLVMPGFVYVAISDAAYHRVAEQIRDKRWGWLNRDPLDRATVQSLAAYAADAHDGPGALWGATHPVRIIAESVLQSRGWHGRLQENDWTLTDATGHAAVDAAFQDLWMKLVEDWNERRPIAEILGNHRELLEGVAYPVALTETRRGRDWQCTWLDQTGRIPDSAHAAIRPRATRVWAVMVQAEPLTFAMTHPDLLRQRLRYRVPYQDAARVPGRWAAILVPQVTDTVRMHVRQAAHALGWSEHWQAVASNDPAGIVRTLLKPRSVAFDRANRRILLDGIASERMGWLDRAGDWLPEWTLVLS